MLQENTSHCTCKDTPEIDCKIDAKSTEEKEKARGITRDK